MSIKHNIRAILNFLHLDITKNLEYDRLTHEIIKSAVSKDDVCIDIGCHKGEILDLILKQSPLASHYVFEPIPALYQNLVNKYAPQHHIYAYALADFIGKTSFQFVKNAPAYSGLKKRNYAVENPDIEEIEVEVSTLDKLIPATTKIAFIKIDVEGGELGVLKGGVKIISENKPIIIFECGLGASEFYNTQPEDIYNLLNEAGLKISLLKSWLTQKPNLNREQFCNCYHTNKEYYFIAHP
ncbi:MAG: FkbM family methyltransferase [Bacteroidetes bacterium]|nr:FkbM family methyltransferase [Bacteroidota bacterium]